VRQRLLRAYAIQRGIIVEFVDVESAKQSGQRLPRCLVT
jgi:hypothetical protein